MPKLILLIIILAAAGYFGFNQFNSKTYIRKDTVIEGNYSVSDGKTTVLKNGAKLTVRGDMTVDGQFECEDGPLNLEVSGFLKVDGAINCQRDENAAGGGALVEGLNLVLPGSAEFGSNSVITSNGNIQIVESVDLLLKTKEDIKRAYDETVEDTGGIKIGPFVPDSGTASSAEIKNYYKAAASNISTTQNSKTSQNLLEKFSLVKTAYAQGVQDHHYALRGIMHVGQTNKSLPKNLNLKKIPRGIDLVLVWFNMPSGTMELTDGKMYTPDGQNGLDKTGGCVVDIPKMEKEDGEKGGFLKKEKNGLRMRVNAKVVKVNNFDLFMGDGGKGGNAETDKNCDPGVAFAGDGGQPANFKWTAEDYIEIKGALRIHPGRGGDGGKAIAWGKDGEADSPIGKPGGNAAAVGGNGADNKRSLRATGDVRGLSNILVGSMSGGNGGEALVNSGKGGQGKICDAQGGPGGTGAGKGGKGGEVILSLPRGVQRLPGAEDKKGASAKSYTVLGQRGEDGPVCEDKTQKPPAKKDSTGGSTSNDYLPGFFEFIDLANGQKSIGFSTAQKPHIIVATDGQPDARTWLPIKVVLKVDGSEIWTKTISGNPSQICRGETGCSTDGPSINPNWRKIELLAYDKNGKLVATFGEIYSP